MDDRRTIRMALGQGERRQVLLEEGCTVLVLAGRLSLRESLAWLAEQAVAGACRLGAEEAWVAGRSGWVELGALGPVSLVVLPAESLPFWRQVGRCLEGLLGGAPAAKVGVKR